MESSSHSASAPCRPLSLLLLPLLLLAATLAGTASAMQMALDYGSKKCITATAPRATAVYVEFNVASGSPPMNIDLYVTSERGAMIEHRTNIAHEKFTIPAQHHSRALPDPKGGGYDNFRLCMLHQVQRHEPRASGSRRIFFDIYQDVELPKDQLLLTSQADETSSKIRQLETRLMHVLRTMDHLKAQEEQLSEINSATAGHLVFVSSLTSVVIIAVGLIQFDSIKGALRKSNLIR